PPQVRRAQACLAPAYRTRRQRAAAGRHRSCTNCTEGRGPPLLIYRGPLSPLEDPARPEKAYPILTRPPTAQAAVPTNTVSTSGDPTATAAAIIKRIAAELTVRDNQVASAVDLLDGGATVPFIARYRKEATGTLDDAQLRTLEERLRYLREL